MVRTTIDGRNNEQANIQAFKDLLKERAVPKTSYQLLLAVELIFFLISYNFKFYLNF